jgi:hypothetical protein
MKHANDLFAQAVNQLIELGDKARKERRERDTRNGGRETARVVRKRVRQTELQFK